VQELEAQAYEQGSLVLRTDAARGADFNEVPVAKAIGSDPEVKRRDAIRRIEFLQGMLLKVERYRMGHGAHA
jgi:hypothetical protein